MESKTLPPCPECARPLLDLTTQGDTGTRRYMCAAGHGIFTSAELAALAADNGLPFITCICPTKNRRRFLSGMIAGFLAQDYEGPVELLIVEDGDENCEDLIPLDTERPIRYFRHDGSLGAKLNFGATQARGEMLANVDDDDWYTPDRLAKQLQHFWLTGKQVCACSSGLFWVEGESTGFEYHGPANYAMGATHFYTRDFALAHPHDDISLGEDTAFSNTAHAAGELATISGMEVLVVRCHPGNTSKRDYSDPAQKAWMLCTDNWREVPLSRIQAVIGPQTEKEK